VEKREIVTGALSPTPRPAIISSLREIIRIACFWFFPKLSTLLFGDRSNIHDLIFSFYLHTGQHVVIYHARGPFAPHNGGQAWSSSLGLVARCHHSRGLEWPSAEGGKNPPLPSLVRVKGVVTRTRRVVLVDLLRG
jgi:hypothetical protein